MSETSLAEWSTDRLRHEVSKLLGSDAYLWMTPSEMEASGFPSTDALRREFIRKHRETAADSVVAK